MADNNIDTEEREPLSSAEADPMEAPTEHDEEATPPPEKPVGSHSTSNVYHAILINFMSHFHEKSTPYPNDHEFSSEDLRAVTPNDVCVYLNKKAFGRANPGLNDKLTSNWSGVEFIRKAIDHYMPQDNNPAKSSQVKTLMDSIRLLSTRTGGGFSRFPQDSTAESALTEQDPLFESNVTAAQLLNKLHSRNAQFLSIIQSMDSTIRTLNRAVQQMKRALESHNVEMPDNDVTSLPMLDHTATTVLVAQLNEEENGLAAELKKLTNYTSYPASMRTTGIKVGPDGFVTFFNEMGKEMDLPEGFELPTCDLIDAWTAWLKGFPNHKFQTSTVDGEEESLVSAPIKPLRNMKLGSIPSSLKKKYKDGWRPILQHMTAAVEQMLAGVPPSEMDETFINATFTAAMDVLIDKLPTMVDGKNERSKTWKVATWSRKIREVKPKKQETHGPEESSAYLMKEGDEADIEGHEV
jgi:hypothetical protein